MSLYRFSWSVRRDVMTLHVYHRRRRRCFRFNDFKSRYTSLMNRTTTTTTTAASSSSTTSSSTAYQSAYIPLSRRRQLEQEENEKKDEQNSSHLSTTTSTVSPTSPTGTTTTSSIYRRLVWCVNDCHAVSWEWVGFLSQLLQMEVNYSRRNIERQIETSEVVRYIYPRNRW